MLIERQDSSCRMRKDLEFFPDPLKLVVVIKCSLQVTQFIFWQDLMVAISDFRLGNFAASVCREGGVDCSIMAISMNWSSVALS